MTARVLIVDDIPVNLRLLETHLNAEYFIVLKANSGAEALEICAKEEVDIVLLDVMMPEMDGFEVCKRLKADPHTHHLPIIMVTALDQPADRIKGLEAGADDFLTKPFDVVQLMARVKSLVRLKALTDELRARATTKQQMDIEDADRVMDAINVAGSRVMIIDNDERHATKLKEILQPDHKVDIITNPSDAVVILAEHQYEIIIVSMALETHDPLRICSQLRTLEQGRNVPILLIAQEEDKEKVIRGLELGVNDFISRPIERHEFLARVRTQVRRYRYATELRESVSSTLQLAIIDELTKLYNRRYFDRHLDIMLKKAMEQGRGMAVMMLDIDHFKQVNDQWGHDAGDKILIEFAKRIQRNIRGIDLPCRYGGEEFVVLMPDIDRRNAHLVGERVRTAIENIRFDTGNGIHIPITVSAGIAFNKSLGDSPTDLLKRADVALYKAKSDGRNRVILDVA